MAQTVKQCLPCGRLGFSPWVGKISWRRKWQPIPVFLPGKSYGQRGLVGYSPWGHKGSDTTERLHFTHLRRKQGFPRDSVVHLLGQEMQKMPFNPWLGRSPGGRKGNPLRYSCLENPMDRGAWRATLHGVSKIRQPSN